MTRIVVYSRPGTVQHDRLCDAFLGEARGWYMTKARGDFWEIVTMESGWGPDGRYTRWVLIAAPRGMSS